MREQGYVKALEKARERLRSTQSALLGPCDWFLRGVEECAARLAVYRVVAHAVPEKDPTGEGPFIVFCNAIGCYGRLTPIVISESTILAVRAKMGGSPGWQETVTCPRCGGTAVYVLAREVGPIEDTGPVTDETASAESDEPSLRPLISELIKEQQATNQWLEKIARNLPVRLRATHD